MRYSLDHQVTVLPTQANTVAEALQEQGIIIEPEDSVTPPLDSPITDQSIVSVVFSKDIRVRVGSQDKKRRLVAAVTVNEAVQKLQIPVDADDKLSPGYSVLIQDGDTLLVDRVKYKRIVKHRTVKNKTITKKTSSMYKGETRVKRAGRAGKKQMVYERKIVNGERVRTKLVKSKTVRQPVRRVVLVGISPRPTLSGVWSALAQCESGGNPHVVGGGGLYFGLFQFSIGTWNAVGGSGSPSNASPGEQLKRAKILQARSGWGQWPYCSSKLGLI